MISAHVDTCQWVMEVSDVFDLADQRYITKATHVMRNYKYYMNRDPVSLPLPTGKLNLHLYLAARVKFD